MSKFVDKLKSQVEQQDDFKFFGIEPQNTGRALLFELRFRSGRRLGFPYSYLTKLDFEPSEGITIYASDVVILVKGRNLEVIFSYLLQNRLTYIREDETGTDAGGEGETFVEGVEVKQRGEFETI
jgi:hypothetical protein